MSSPNTPRVAGVSGSGGVRDGGTVAGVGSGGLTPGDRVTVPDDHSGQCVFVRRGDPSDSVAVGHGADGRPSYRADVGWVRYPDGSVKAWRHAELRKAK